MKGLEKLTSVRLAEVLSQKSLVAGDVLTDALYSQDQFGESFVDVLVSGGYVSEWDLAKIVVDHFQVPFIMASHFDISKEACESLPKEIIFKNQIVALDTFGDGGVSIAMPILTSYEVLDQIQREYNVDLFPHVGLISENKTVIQEHFSDFHEWQTEQDKQVAKSKEVEDPNQRDWMNIFDAAEEAVQSSKRPN